MKRTAYAVVLLLLLLPFVGCAGGNLKASTIKPYTDQLAATLPVLIDEVLPLITDPEKRARIEGYGRTVTLAMLAIKAAVDAAAAAEPKVEPKPGGND